MGAMKFCLRPLRGINGHVPSVDTPHNIRSCLGPLCLSTSLLVAEYKSKKKAESRAMSRTSRVLFEKYECLIYSSRSVRTCKCSSVDNRFYRIRCDLEIGICRVRSVQVQGVICHGFLEPMVYPKPF